MNAPSTGFLLSITLILLGMCVYTIHAEKTEDKLPSEHKKVTVVILYKDKTWEERDMQFMMPVESTKEEIYRHAVYATMSNLAAVGDVEKVYTVSVISGTQEIEIEFKKVKEEDASPH